MQASGPAGSQETPMRVGIVASPPLVADALSRLLASAGWKIGRIASSISDLQGYERDLTMRDVVVALDGAMPAATIADELRRRVPGLRTVVIGQSDTSTNPSILPSSTDLRSLLRHLELLSPAPIGEAILTPRHLEILQLIASGHSTDEVGDRLGIAAKTVNNHLSAVYKRLGARNLTQAVLRAIRAGLIDPNGAEPTTNAA
jgi:DNA-binding CsgD family transcriptional regulator